MKNKFWYFYTTFRSISTFFLSRKLLIVRICTQIPPTRTLKMKYMTLNLDHTLKYDSKTRTIFFLIFCTTSAKILFSLHFQTLQIIEYGPIKFFPQIPFENTRFYVPQNEKKSKLIFWEVWLVFSHWATNRFSEKISWIVFQKHFTNQFSKKKKLVK